MECSTISCYSLCHRIWEPDLPANVFPLRSASLADIGDSCLSHRTVSVRPHAGRFRTRPLTSSFALCFPRTAMTTLQQLLQAECAPDELLPPRLLPVIFENGQFKSTIQWRLFVHQACQQHYGCSALDVMLRLDSLAKAARRRLPDSQHPDAILLTTAIARLKNRNFPNVTPVRGHPAVVGG
jgi:hypothetical protein